MASGTVSTVGGTTADTVTGSAAKPDELTPRAFLQAAAHPVRWKLLGELGRSDRRVHELTALVGEPQNLVSYHLGKLRDARLVSARQSSADRRDAYYRVDLTRMADVLAATGTAVHPGLRLERRSPALETATRPSGPRPRVLFLCTGNSARSQMAEALAAERSGGWVASYSAGSDPKALHPDAVSVMRDEHGIDISAHRPKHLAEFSEERFDHVITLCDRVREVCPDFPGHPDAIHWSIADPSAVGGDVDATHRAFQQTADELETRIGFLIAGLTDRVDTTPPRPQERS